MRGWWVATRIAAVAVVRRLLRRPGRSVTVQAGVASASAVAGSTTVSRGMVGPFTPPPGQSVEQQVAALGALVNRLREEVLREPQERERAIAAEREARQAELRSVADRLEDTTAALRREVGELRETTTGGTRLRLEGVPLLLAGIIFTTGRVGSLGRCRTGRRCGSCCCS